MCNYHIFSFPFLAQTGQTSHEVSGAVKEELLASKMSSNNSLSMKKRYGLFV